MAHVSDYLKLTLSWDTPGLSEAIEPMIARAWADGFRQGVNAERAGDGPFGADVLAARYRDWRGYGPGAVLPGRRPREIRAEDETAERIGEAAAKTGLAKLRCEVHHGPWPCSHAEAASRKGIKCWAVYGD